MKIKSPDLDLFTSAFFLEEDGAGLVAELESGEERLLPSLSPEVTYGLEGVTYGLEGVTYGLEGSHTG